MKKGKVYFQKQNTYNFSYMSNTNHTSCSLPLENKEKLSIYKSIYFIFFYENTSFDHHHCSIEYFESHIRSIKQLITMIFFALKSSMNSSYSSNWYTFSEWWSMHDTLVRNGRTWSSISFVCIRNVIYSEWMMC